MAEANPMPVHSRFKDLTGSPPFERLTVVRFTRLGKKGAYWLCRCECGTEREVLGHHLRDGSTRSCGCLRRRAKTHGLTGTPEYEAWSGMIQRCTNPNCKDFREYGAAGITVCQRWRESFEAFLADLGTRPSPDHSLDRYPDQDGNYEPGNVRWATRTQQNRNRRTSRLISHNGRTLCLAEWAEQAGIVPETLACRLRSGWGMERALLTGIAPQE